MPNGLNKMQLEALAEKDGQDSRKKRHDKREERDRGAGAGGSATRGGSGDPRDAEVRALRKQFAELQRRTSAKSPKALAAFADSSSPSDSEHSECTANGTLASRVDSSAHPASRHEGSRRRGSWTCAAGGSGPSAGGGTSVPSEEGRKTMMEAVVVTLERRSAATPGAHARYADRAQAVGGHCGDCPSPGLSRGLGCGHRLRRVHRGRSRLTACSPHFEIEEVKLTAEEMLLLREACKKTKLG